MNVESILDYANSKSLVGAYKLQISELIEDQGIKLSEEDLPPEISGKLYKNENQEWCIIVNRTHSLNRKRYTMAHEFAHFCLHRNGLESFEDTSFFRKDENKTAIEYEANQFAAELLMPENIIEKAINNDLLSLKQLSESFGVSLIAIKNRLIELGYKLIENE